MADFNRQTALCLAAGLQEMHDHLRRGAFKEAGWAPLPNHLWQSPAGERVEYIAHANNLTGYSPPVRVYEVPGAWRREDYEKVMDMARERRLEIVQL